MQLQPPQLHLKLLFMLVDEVLEVVGVFIVHLYHGFTLISPTIHRSIVGTSLDDCYTTYRFHHPNSAPAFSTIAVS